MRIRPLPVRPVQRSKMTTADKCPATNPNAPVAPTGVLVTCDLARTNLYTLGPETMQLTLTRVDPPTPLTADYFEVHLTMDPSSAAAWASFTTDHLHAHIAFVRDDLVLEAPTIQEPVTSGQIALTTQTAAAADELARLAGQPG
ncbi:preprotein translocase subunit SecD [Mycobacterium sp. 852002-51163_SCH5372311]|nr:preprotein translocase subunit SecD [Mycobacterium sp. 852002-51163_SCH5372311]